MNTTVEKTNETGLEIAVIGMAGRFPGATNIAELWENLKNGVESISFFTDRELANEGVDLRLLESPDFVKVRGGVIDNVDCFDAFFFGYTPEEAELLNPQVRIFLECAWEALENAGINPGYQENTIGLYAGAAHNFDWDMLTLLSGKTALRITGRVTSSLFLESLSYMARR